MKTYYSVKTVIYDNLTAGVKRCDAIEYHKMPQDTFASECDKDVYID